MKRKDEGRKEGRMVKEGWMKEGQECRTGTYNSIVPTMGRGL
jgi:hypothetical protein